MADTFSYPVFTPGAGGLPPYLAGRRPAQDHLRAVRERLLQGKSTHRDVIIIGPRGNGKTALLRWFEKVCSQDSELDVVWLTPSKVPDLEALAMQCAPPNRWQTFLPTVVELGISVVDFKWQFGNQPASFTQLLEARCKKRPLALLLDEAHTLDPQVGNSLLNASQEVRAKAPFLLALAGTPGLEYKLDQMSATFWSRAKKLGIGRLDEDGARAALVEPFKQHGILFSGPVLDEIIHDSQRYPYFLQCWGSALVNVLQARENPIGQAARQIDADIVAAARPEFEEERLGHYEIFRGQIDKTGLQPLAAAVSLAYGNSDALQEHVLNIAIDQALQRTAPSAQPPPLKTEIIKQREALAGFGYIWKPPASAGVWVPGVPSLMQHVLQIEQKEELRYAATAGPQQAASKPTL